MKLKMLCLLAIGSIAACLVADDLAAEFVSERERLVPSNEVQAAPIDEFRQTGEGSQFVSKEQTGRKLSRFRQRLSLTTPGAGEITRRGSTIGGAAEPLRAIADTSAAAQAINPLSTIPELPSAVPGRQASMQRRVSAFLQGQESMLGNANEVMASDVQHKVPALQDEFSKYKEAQQKIGAQKATILEQIKESEPLANKPLKPQEKLKQQQNLEHLYGRYRTLSTEQESLQSSMRGRINSVVQAVAAAPVHESVAEPVQTRKPVEVPAATQNRFKSSGYDSVMERLRTWQANKIAAKNAPLIQTSEIAPTRARSGAVTGPLDLSPREWFNQSHSMKSLQALKLQKIVVARLYRILIRHT